MGLSMGIQAAGSPLSKRRIHVCLSPKIINEEPAYLQAARTAGVSKIWLAGFFYGHWPYSLDALARARQRVLDAGLDAGLINIPLGHPGDSLGAREGDFPLTPPNHWHLAASADGKQYAGTSLHEPATQENKAALRQLKGLGFQQAFLDDDFRLARGPGIIGGCFCDQHRQAFLRKAGLPYNKWQELLEDIRLRKLTRLLRQWVEFTCDELTASFRAQQWDFDGELGIMAMYLGSEKAGIRLGNYRRNLFRVGELMFNDASFGSVKGKTDELFSVLFHRQHIRSDRAYSETTAYPANQLSAANLAAKLVISTIADVRHTMFMSGLTPFPLAHWDTLRPAISEQIRMHDHIAGQSPNGPLKLYWGEAQRYAGDDQPFSLWLAMGIPFESTTHPSSGWVFLSDQDAINLSSKRWPSKARVVCRSSSGVAVPGWTHVKEDFAELIRLKHSILPQLAQTPFLPYIEEDVPAVCAWYPASHSVMVWNLQEKPVELSIMYGKKRHPIKTGPLGTALLRIITD
jgi:hypothetical protein